ncbi:MAG: flavodoxin family protein [Verrucomicrobia bacterium]|jgi:multimeric flavodoxin WrbA|nr:flavodoxin family protein [Verrucomicrobiota bacterium]
MKQENLTRRNFLATAGVAALATSLAPGAEETSKGKALKILGIACSPRKGMTTAKAVQAALDAAKSVDARITVELIDLGGLSIAGWSPAIPKDDFDVILPKLKDPQLGGLIIASPSYFRSLSSLCKAFIERCMPLREDAMLLANKPVGALAVGGNRNGGQELVIEQILMAMLSYGMVPVGGKSPAMLGGTLWNTKDDVSQDESGLQSARLLGTHVAEVALKLFKNP